MDTQSRGCFLFRRRDYG
ncbi:hypothetical protein CPZ25_014850 [Eubacterium maltosivorans]|uniref:Uncharacterized protein n=1 Tax=Eubacterium maltosivorans TaxID=2041044 RepID=A0A4P9CFW7_EUBML|nr:hypothetical protein CPZ25_014850 [Eubacterium maltosivorans]